MWSISTSGQDQHLGNISCRRPEKINAPPGNQTPGHESSLLLRSDGGWTKAVDRRDGLRQHGRFKWSGGTSITSLSGLFGLLSYWRRFSFM